MMPLFRRVYRKYPAFLEDLRTRAERYNRGVALAQDYAAKGWSITIGAADSHPDPAAGEAWTAQVAELFPGCDIQYRPLPFSIGCHIGPGAFGLTVSRRLAR